jgi:general secretion pathway protein J
MTMPSLHGVPCSSNQVALRLRHAGFTLVEVMVSLAVLSLLMLATVSALRTFANTQGSLERKISRVDEIRSVSSFLRQALQSNVVAQAQGESGGLSLGGAPPSQSAFFRGTPRSVEWKAPMMFGEGYGGTFLIRVGREANQLTLRWQDPPDDDDGFEPDWRDTPVRVVIDNLEEFSVAYRLDYKEGWKEGIAIESPPVMVRLAIKSSGRYWPDLIAEVQR